MNASLATGFAVVVAALAGFAAGYQINAVTTPAAVAAVDENGAKLEVPSNEQASAALQKSGRSMRISECRHHPVSPGVICTGMITTTSGSFAGSTEAGILSFAKIDGVWTQIH